MSDPTRWASLNESERRFLRAGILHRDCVVAGRIPPLGYLPRKARSLTDDPPATEVIALPEGWHVEERNGYWDLCLGERTVARLFDDGDLGSLEDVLAPAPAWQALLHASGLYRVEAVNG